MTFFRCVSARPLTLLITPLFFTLTVPQAFADFISDSKASIDMRNFYFNRDFRQPTATQSKQEEWAQAFTLRYASGYTSGPVGVGLDMIGQLGIKLDSSPDRAGSGLLPRGRSAPRRAPDDFGRLGPTIKLRASNSQLKVGTLIPRLPTVLANDTRLIQQTYRGAHLNSSEIDGLTLDFGRLDRVSQRDSSNAEKMTITTGGAKGIVVGKSSDRFDFAGLTYQWQPRLATGLHYGRLEGLYEQKIINLVHTLPIAQGQVLKTDLRYAWAKNGTNSNVDNRALGGMFTYTLDSHAFTVTFQKMNGKTGYPYLGNGDPFLVNLVQISEFANRNERSMQARYEYDFTALGVPGLTFMTRYVKGDSIELGGGLPECSEWERNTDLGYVIQSGPMKNVGIKLRNATVRSRNFGSDIDENRLIFNYTLALW